MVPRVPRERMKSRINPREPVRLSLVPKLYLGTHALLKFYFSLILCAIGLPQAMVNDCEVQLRTELRSQIEFGNERQRGCVTPL